MLQNKNFQQSSDIFHVKDSGKPELNEPPRRIRHNNRSATDLLAWKRDPVKWNKEESKRNVSPKMSQEPEHKICFAKGTSGKRTSSNVDLRFGKFESSDYIVKKEKNKAYDPNKYYVEQNPYERKAQLLRGSGNFVNNENSKVNTIYKNSILQNRQKQNNKFNTSEKKSSFGTMNNEFSEEKPNFKLMENLQHNDLPAQGKEINRGTLKREIMNPNSTGIGYDHNKETISNRVDMLKSNIFNDPEKEKLNRVDSTKNLIKDTYKGEVAIPHKKTNRMGKEKENYITKLDWRDTKTNLYFKGEENSDIKPIDRKMKELYGGKEVAKGYYSSRKCEDDKSRTNLMEKIAKSGKGDSIAKIRKQVESMSYYQDDPITKNVNKPIKDLPEKKFELKNFDKSNNVDIEGVEKTFHNKGLHIYGIKHNPSFRGEDGTQGKITFKLRNNENNSINFNKKLNDVKKELKEKNGYDFEHYVKKKKPL